MYKYVSKLILMHIYTILASGLFLTRYAENNQSFLNRLLFLSPIHSRNLLYFSKRMYHKVENRIPSAVLTLKIGVESYAKYNILCRKNE